MTKCASCEQGILAVAAEIDPRTLSLQHRAQCGHLVPREISLALWKDGMRWDLPNVTGAAVIAAERARQVHEEGYTPEHDAEHDPADLTWASWCLLDASASGEKNVDPPKMWPWSAESWKPDHSPLRRLVIAGALIAAEIDRHLMEARRPQ